MRPAPSPSLGFWHPVLLEKELGRGPRAVKLCGESIAVYRDASGAIGALDDACAHRGMRLSAGHVRKECLVCPYHAWSYDADGKGHAPSMPDARVRVGAYDTRVEAGAIWIRRKGSTAAFPAVFGDERAHLTTIRVTLSTPFELLLDNFSEIEHWHTVHQYLGYALRDIGRVRFDVDAGERSVHVVATGPQKPLPFLLARALGLRSGDPFREEWTTWFEPIHTVYRHGWYDPSTGRERPMSVRFANFFCPVDDRTTDLFVFAFLSAERSRVPLLRALHRRLVEAMVRREVTLDRTIVEDLAARGPSLAGLRLGPLDRAIVANRKRIERIYRHGPGAAPVVERDAEREPCESSPRH